MKCKSHEWLFIRDISRPTEESEEFKATADAYKKKADDQGKWPWWKTRTQVSTAMALASAMSLMTMENGRKYVCANCDEVKEVF